MFKIKTKKDKKIEELCSEFTVPFESLDTIPEEHIKRVLANKMLEVVEENLEIEANDDMLRNLKIYRAKLRVVKK